MSDKYILDKQGNPVHEPHLMKWADWFEKAERRVADEEVNGARISTVFLGVDHNFTSNGVPVLWETMIFGGTLDQIKDRCSGGLEDAKAMHARMVNRVLEAN